MACAAASSADRRATRLHRQATAEAMDAGCSVPKKRAAMGVGRLHDPRAFGTRVDVTVVRGAEEIRAITTKRWPRPCGTRSGGARSGSRFGEVQRRCNFFWQGVGDVVSDIGLKWRRAELGPRRVAEFDYIAEVRPLCRQPVRHLVPVRLGVSSPCSARRFARPRVWLCAPPVGVGLGSGRNRACAARARAAIVVAVRAVASHGQLVSIAAPLPRAACSALLGCSQLGPCVVALRRRIAQRWSAAMTAREPGRAARRRSFSQAIVCVPAA